jgi:hypothetical protein
MWVNRNLLAIVMGICLVTSCGLDDLNDPILVTNVEDEFYIEMWEDLSPSNRTLSLRVRTIQDDTCLNTTINTTLLKLGNELILEVNGINEPEDCLEGMAPAKGEEVVGTLSAGLYKMEINLQNTVFNAGQLETNQNRYFLNMETENGINIPSSVLLRVPDNSFWGYIDYGPNELDALAFIESLEEVATRPNLSIGYYGYYTVKNDPNDWIEITNRPNSNRLVSFLLVYEEENESTIKNMIADFRSNNSSLGLSVKNYQGLEW